MCSHAQAQLSFIAPHCQDTRQISLICTAIVSQSFLKTSTMKLSYLMTTAIPWHLTIPTLVYASRPITRSLLQLTDCPSTCSPALCDCVSKHSPSSCASEVHSVCSSEKVNHCVPTEAVGQFRSLHCPFAACLVDGRSEEECECELLGKTCETFEENDMGFCEMAKCCKEQVGDDGKAKCLSGELVNDERPSDIEFDGSAIGSTADKLSQSSFEMDALSFIPLIDDLIPVTDDLSVDAMDTLDVSSIHHFLSGLNYYTSTDNKAIYTPSGSDIDTNSSSKCTYDIYIATNRLLSRTI